MKGKKEMEVLVKEGQSKTKDVHIRNNGKILSMFYMNVGDIFWAINKSDVNSTIETFDIPKSEGDIYCLFDTLFDEICKSRNNSLRNLYDSKTNVIEWHSDETYFDSDDIVKIIKQDNNYHLEFTRPGQYEDPFYLGSPSRICIRFRTSGSYYDKLDVPFVKMYRKSQRLKERGFEEIQRSYSHPEFLERD